MTKTLAISLNLAFIVLIGFFQKSEIKITHNFPTSLKPGEEKVVNIELDKSDVVGFAKLQFTLDEGLSAELVEASGASFTFNNQAAKFIWMALPQTKKITLKMRVIAKNEASGILKVKTRFSYIYQNERKNVDIAEHGIAVGTGENDIAQIKETYDAKIENNEAQVAVGRTITNTGINQWRVDIDIDRKDLHGFARVEEIFPAGFTVIDLKSSSAVFTVEDQILKYVWYDLPDQDRVTVSYKLLPIVAMDGAQPEVKGNFSYLIKDETTSVNIFNGASQFIPAPPKADEVAKVIPPVALSTEVTPEIKEETIAAVAKMKAPAAVGSETTRPSLAEAIITTPTPVKVAPANATAPKNEAMIAAAAATPVQKPKQVSRPLPKENTTPAPKSQTTPAPAPQKSFNDGNIVDVPKPEKGVYFKVQIAAGQNNLNKNLFAKLYTFTENFMLESHSGMYKYTTGYHQVYKTARDDRERISTKYDKFKGPFVTAYNDGERITVQEALMITSQKWYQ